MNQGHVFCRVSLEKHKKANSKHNDTSYICILYIYIFTNYVELNYFAYQCTTTSTTKNKGIPKTRQSIVARVPASNLASSAMSSNCSRSAWRRVWAMAYRVLRLTERVDPVDWQPKTGVTGFPQVNCLSTYCWFSLNRSPLLEVPQKRSGETPSSQFVGLPLIWSIPKTQGALLIRDPLVARDKLVGYVKTSKSETSQSRRE